MDRIIDGRGHHHTLTEADHRLLRDTIAYGVFLGLWLFAISLGAIAAILVGAVYYRVN